VSQIYRQVKMAVPEVADQHGAAMVAAAVVDRHGSGGSGEADEQGADFSVEELRAELERLRVEASSRVQQPVRVVGRVRNQLDRISLRRRPCLLLCCCCSVYVCVLSSCVRLSQFSRLTTGVFGAVLPAAGRGDRAASGHAGFG
jgi:hypothetical protein